MMTRLLGLSLAFFVIMSPAMVWAERVWDSQLKRYLTDQEMAHAEVFLTEEDALKLMFPQSERIRKEVLKLSPEKKLQIEERIGWKFPEESFEVYVGETGTQINGYALVQNTIGKHKPMTYMVGIGNTGHVLNVELLVFREARGSEVRTKRFNVQYEGKAASDPVRLNKDIINISGATMSVRSMTAGIKRVLVLVDEFYLKPAGLGSDTVAAKKIGTGDLRIHLRKLTGSDAVLNHAQLQHSLPSPRLGSAHPAGLHLLSLLDAGWLYLFLLLGPQHDGAVATRDRQSLPGIGCHIRGTDVVQRAGRNHPLPPLYDAGRVYNSGPCALSH